MPDLLKKIKKNGASHCSFTEAQRQVEVAIWCSVPFEKYDSCRKKKESIHKYLMRWPSLICHKKFCDLCWSFVAFQWLQSQDKTVFLSLMNSDRGNKSSKKMPLRAGVTDRMSRAQSSLELFYSSPLEPFNRYGSTKFTYCQEFGTEQRAVRQGESARGSKARYK